MHAPFSSPFILEKTSSANAGKFLKHFQNALPALTYYLEQALPRGSVICALFPKEILSRILPIAAKNKNCTVLSHTGGTLPDADIYIVEPDGFTQGGAFVQPAETISLEELDLIGIGSALQWTPANPATHDYVALAKVITELGIHSPADLEVELRTAFSWLTPSLLSAASQARPANP